jgi:hypothetical protein
MKRTKLAFIASALALSLIAAGGPASAAYPVDSSSAANDPLANLLDLYAFVQPYCQTQAGQGCEADPEELVLALTLYPEATGAEQFSEDVVYHFHFENDSGERDQIDCSFSADQVVSCSGLDGLSVQARVGETGVNGDLRVFAGLRDNPVFFDFEAFELFQQIGIAAYSDPGTDSLAGTNVLAIVLGIKITAMSSGSTPNHNVQKIWAASERTGGDGINGAISGSWYNRETSGQGWVVEVVGLPSGGVDFLSYFYGYDNNGEQLWFITGATTIDGNQVTADVYRPTATGFGGDYDRESFVLGDVVGSVTFEFETCDAGTVNFTSADAATLPDFSTDIERLSSIASLDCSLLSAGQVDRVGRPFAAALIPADMRDAYNANSDPDTWVAAYSAPLRASLELLATADGDPAWNGFYTLDDWPDIFADDRLQVDVKLAQSVDFMTIERAVIEGTAELNPDSSGRRLDYDIHENLFNVLITSFDPFVDDFVAGNDVPFLDDFPFLASPH